MTNYVPTIGLEIHAELKTQTKMFCRCKNDPFSKDPNKYVCPVCLGLPGALPTMNEQAVINTILIGKAINGEITPLSKWDRKHYFYPDLPKGYQISQYDAPLVEGGNVMINDQKIGITRIHLEEDTGKLLHTSGASLIDYNRAGVPLVELVTEPDIHDGQTARLFAEEYQLILRTLNVSSADMEKGEMRVEVNISVAEAGKRGTKVEIKNINSFKAVEKAIEYEIKRQSELLESGEAIVQETRGWNIDRGTTISQRVKETSADYRYFPEPDLPPVDTTKLIIPNLPALPHQIRQELSAANIKPADIEFLLTKPALREKLNLISKGNASLVGTVAMILINQPQTATLESSQLMDLAQMTPHERKLHLSGQTHAAMDEQAITAIVKNIMGLHGKAITEYKAGKTSVLGFIIGQVMRETKGQADPVLVKKIVLSNLSA